MNWTRTVLAGALLVLLAAGPALAQQASPSQGQMGSQSGQTDQMQPGQAGQTQPGQSGQMQQPGQTGQSGQSGQQQAGQTDSQGRIALGEVEQVQAKITAINKHDRTVTLQANDGRTMTIKADRKAARFEELKVGDTIRAQVFQALLIGAGPQGQSQPDVSTVQITAPGGREPAELTMASINMQATVESVDTDKRTVTLKTPEGATMTMKIGQQVDMNQIKTGQTIHARYIMGVAVELEKQS